MGTKRLDYFYDSQLKSYLQQVVAAFHGFCIQTTTRDGDAVLRQVPVRWGDPSRMAAQILKNNSENIINSAPFITVAISNMAHAPARRHDPGFTEHLKVAEREFDEDAGLYTTKQGNKYSVYRYMPVPYDMTIQVDIWTSNTDQKFQLFEQIGVLYNPDVWFQSNVNPLDWSAITTIMQEGITWSSRAIPVGTESQIDIMSWTFLVPVWINPPAKVKRQSIIHQIITNIVDHECFAIGTDNRYDDSDLLAQLVTTPGNHQVRVDGDEITLLGNNGSDEDAEGNIYEWIPLLDKYGSFEPGSTLLYLKRYSIDLDDYTNDIVGTLDFHPTKPNILLFTVDPTTLPPNTLDPVDAIIDPHVQYPGFGLPIFATGQRYLLTSNMWTDEIGGEDKDAESGVTVAWDDLVAKEHDVIEYNGTKWVVAFNSSASNNQQFTVNSFTQKQLFFDGTEWILAVDGEYSPGFWRLGIAGFNPGAEEEPCA